jgi:PAS domain S-box-containing protein
MQPTADLLLESTGEGIFGIDLEGRCTFINRAGARALGYEQREVLGRNMHELTHHSHADGRHYPDGECPIFNAFRQGRPCRIDSEVFWRRDRTAFPVEYSSYPIVDGVEVRGAVVTFVDITERLRGHELSAALTRQRELGAYSEQVREEERTRIAREVHDELGSLLVALKMDVDWLDKRLSEQAARDAGAAHAMRERMRAKCGNMSRLIENAVGNVGRIITDLRPSILDHQGLWAALEWQAHEFAGAAELDLDWDCGGPLPELPGPAAVAVFRIFQEMLSNVGRHAQARRVTVHASVSQDRLSLAVADDGRGAPAEAFEAPDAYGIMGMRERARHLGGQLAIASAPGRGATFTLSLPVARHA